LGGIELKCVLKDKLIVGQVMWQGPFCMPAIEIKPNPDGQKEILGR
jgi:hypothetical protein